MKMLLTSEQLYQLILKQDSQVSSSYCAFIYGKIEKCTPIYIGAQIFMGTHKTKSKSNII